MISKNCPYIGIEEINAILNAGDGNIRKFEEKFAKFSGADYGVVFPYCRSGIYCLMKTLDVKGKVLMPAYTCVVVPNAVVKADLNVDFGDVSFDDFNMKNNMKGKYGAVIPTHLFGNSVDVGQFKKKHENSFIVEDCALAITQKISDQSDAAFYSFGVNKHITTMEGGIVTTNDKKLYKALLNNRNTMYKRASISKVADRLLRFLSFYGVFKGIPYSILNKATKNEFIRRIRESRNFDKIELPDDNLRLMCEFQAGIGLSQLKKVNEIVDRRRMIVKYYNKRLVNLDADAGKLVMPRRINSSYSHYVLRVKNRDKIRFREKMERNGVEVGRTFDYSCPELDVYKQLGFNGNKYANSSILSKEVVNLPNYPSLTRRKLNKVIMAVESSI